MTRTNHIFLVITFLLIGFAAIIAQTICIREFLVVFSGNEICLGVIFAAWLIGITLGAAFCAGIIDRFRWNIEILAILLIAMCFILPLQIYFIRISRSFIDISTGQYIPFVSLLYMSLLTIAPFSFLVGVIFPVACKAYTELRGNPAVQIGWVYIFEALGSLIGGVIFTFLLVERFNAYQITMIVNIILLIVTFLVLGGSSYKPIKWILKTVCLVLLIGVIYLFSEQANNLNSHTVQKRWQTFNEKIQLIESIDSKYENLAIGKYQDQYTLYGNGHPVFSFPDDYTYAPQANFFLTEHPDPKNVLLIGGTEGLIKEMLKHPIDRLDYVQLDPQAIKMVSKYLPETDREIIAKNKGKRLFIHYQDGRYFVKHTPEKYDLIIIAMPDPSTAMINRFYTVGFFRELKRILAGDGAVITRSTSAVNYFGDAVGNYVGSLYDTLREEFQYVLVTPGTEAYLLASNEPGVVTFDLDILDKRFRERNIQTDYFSSPAHYITQFQLQEWQINFTRDSLAQREYHYINTDLKPITYFFNLVLWDIISRPGGLAGERGKGSFFKTLSGLKYWNIIVFLLALLIIRIGYVGFTPQRRLAHHRFNSLFTMFAIGFAGLSLELVLMFSFQNIYGYIYQKIGLIIALFMLGLAIGGYIANKVIMKRERNWVKTLIWIEGLIVGFALILPFFLRLMITVSVNPIVFMVSEYLFVLLIAISGVITGLVYPVTNKLYLESSSGRVGQTAGLVDSADHLGACLGAILTGIIFVPLFGIEQTCFFVAALNLFSLVLLLNPLKSLSPS